MKLLLHLKGTTLPSESKLRKAGYLAIEVENFDQIKVIEEVKSISATDLNVVQQAALEAIVEMESCTQGPAELKTLFTNKLAAGLLPQKPKKSE